MSSETLAALNSNTLIGFTEKRGKAWHYRANLQADRPNHFPGAIPAERVTELLGFELIEASLTGTALTEDGVLSVDMPDHKLIVRKDTGQGFGIFKSGYKIHQPEEWCHQNLDLIVDGGLQVGSVVVLKGGAVVAVQAELEETRTAAEGVKHRPFLTAATSHDGSMATTYLTGTTVVVCDNTLSAALKEGDSLKAKIRHSRNSLVQLGKVRQDLGLLVEQVGDAFDEQVKKLTSEYVSDDVWNRFVKAFASPGDKELTGRSKTMADTKIATLNRMWNYDERVAPWRNNAYGVIAAINTSVHHEFTVKGATRADRNGLRMATGDFEKLDAGTLRLLASVR